MKPANLAFYKEDGTNWTRSDLFRLHIYMSYTKPSPFIPTNGFEPVNSAVKWVYNMSRAEDELNSWSMQEPSLKAYEELFTTMSFEEAMNPLTKLQIYQIKDY